MQRNSFSQFGTGTPKETGKFTAFPNALLDQLMPTLTDTEWRLLCVVVRQTLGWQSKEGQAGASQRKLQDWLTHSQLQSRTGRASEALSRAVDSLVSKGLIEVCDDRGNALKTAATRRRNGGKLFYSLGPAVRETIALKSAAKSEKPVSENGIRKTKTTKENVTKNSPVGEQTVKPRPPKPENEKHEKSVAHQSEVHQSDVHRFLRAYREGFRQRTPHGEPPVIDWGKDGKLAKQLLSLYSYDRLVQLLERFWTSDDAWTRRQGYSLYAFKASIGRLLIQQGTRQSKLREAINNPVTIHTPGWHRTEEVLPND